MDFDEAFARTINLLERQGFATYRTLKRRFRVDDATLAALKTALVDTQHLAADDAGTRLVWLGELRPGTGPTRLEEEDAPPGAVVPPSVLAPGHRTWTPLVGRAPEVALLQARWTPVLAGQGHVVLLSGEAGIGKSRLVQVVKAQATAQPHQRWECRCDPSLQHSALAPIVELLQRGLHLQPDEAPAGKLQKLEAALAALELALAEVVPLLASLLSIPLDARYTLPPLSPAQQKQRMLDAIGTLLAAVAAQTPVLLIVEDLHWADPSTLELLTLLVDRVKALRCYLLLTHRPEFQAPWVPPAHSTTLTLQRLRPAQGAALVTQVTGGKALPAVVVQQILARTDGVPLFVEEVTQMVLESGLLAEQEGAYVLIGPLPELAIPGTVQESVRARLASLGAAAQHVAQVAAVWGRAVTEGQLQATVGLEEGRRDRAVGRLVAADILHELSLPPRLTYVFKHALLQEAAYESLPQAQRRALHAQIVEALEVLAGHRRAEQVEAVAYHALRGEVWDKAVMYCRQAGEKALAQPAYREAVGSFEQALSALAHLPEQRDTREPAVDLRLALSSALFPLGDLGRSLAVLREAESLATALDDPRRLGQVSRSLSFHFYLRGAYDQTIATAQRTLAFASGDVILHAVANLYLGLAYWAQGDYRRAIGCLRQTVASLDGARHRERFGLPSLPAVLSHSWGAWCHAELGMFAEGSTLGDEGLRIAEAVAHPGSLVNACRGIGLLALRQGDLPRALSLLERAMGLCQDMDFAGYFPGIAAHLGAAYTLAGRIADAVPLLTQALEQMTATEMVVYQTLCHLSLGEAQLLAGRLEEAQALAERTLALACERQERGNEAYALRFLGDIAARREPPESVRAETHYQQALALAEALGMRPLVAHCHLGLGTLYATTGQREQARVELPAAITLYRAMDTTFWLPQAEAALAQVEGEG